MTLGAGLRRHRRSAALGLLIAAFAAAQGARVDAQVATDVAVKAALIYNFAKFAEWPALGTSNPIVVCIVGDEPIAAAFATAVRGQHIGGRKIDLGHPRHSGEWPSCQVLFIAAAQFRQFETGLAGIKKAPILTVSDGEGFARSGGIIELYVDKGLMRFAINMDAVQRSGLNLSSRLLGLAKLMRDATGD